MNSKSPVLILIHTYLSQPAPHAMALFNLLVLIVWCGCIHIDVAIHGKSQISKTWVFLWQGYGCGEYVWDGVGNGLIGYQFLLLVRAKLTDYRRIHVAISGELLLANSKSQRAARGRTPYFPVLSGAFLFQASDGYVVGPVLPI